MGAWVHFNSRLIKNELTAPHHFLFDRLKVVRQLVQMIEVPLHQLSPEALEGVIDDFILRDGTDYGSAEMSLESKRKNVLVQLNKGLAKIVFDPETETITLLAVSKGY